MAIREATCDYCGGQLLLLACDAPFWYHAGATPRHGEWVPEHDCEADAVWADSDDVVAPCEVEAAASWRDSGL